MKTKYSVIITTILLVFTFALLPAINGQALATNDSELDEACAYLTCALDDLNKAASLTKALSLRKRVEARKLLRHAHYSIYTAQTLIMKSTIAGMPLEMMTGMIPKNLADLRSLIKSIPSLLPMLPPMLIDPMVDTLTIETVLGIAEVMVDTSFMMTFGALDAKALPFIHIAEEMLDNMSCSLCGCN